MLSKFSCRLSSALREFSELDASQRSLPDGHVVFRLCAPWACGGVSALRRGNSAWSRLGDSISIVNAWHDLYLVHVVGDSDESWTSRGHANFILDNLIAPGKAEPMIIVMPNGHTSLLHVLDRFNNIEFGGDLLTDLIPYVDDHFRTQPSAVRRAMAGLSMGRTYVQFWLGPA